MAKLKEVLMKSGSKSRLGATSEENLKTLSAKQGRELTPTLPSEAAQLGASPDQAKMTGSSANLKSTLKQAGERETSPAPAIIADNFTAERAQLWRQARKEQTSGEVLKEQLANRLTESSSFLVKDAGEAAVQKFRDAGAKTENLKLELKNSLGMDLGQQRQMDILLSPDSTTEARAGAFNNLRGILPPGLTVEDARTNPETFVNVWNQQIKSSSTQLAETGAANVANEVRVSDIYGTNELPELSSLLGLDANTLKDMTVQQLQEEFNKKTSSEFNETQRLMSLLDNENLSPSEREEVTRQLTDLGAVGVIGLEEGRIRDLEQEIEDADELVIAGRSYDIQSLLDDEAISALIYSYVDSGAGADVLEQLGMKGWVDNNKAALSAASARLSEGTKNLAMAERDNWQDYVNAMQFTGESAKMEDLGNFTGSRKTYEINKLDPESKAVLSGFGKEVINSGLSADELRTIAQFDRTSNRPVAKLKELKKDIDLLNNNISPNSFIDNFTNLLAEARRMQAATGTSNHVIDFVDKDRDGQLDADWKGIFTSQDTSLRHLLSKGPNATYLTGKELANALKEAASGSGGISPDMVDAGGAITPHAASQMTAEQIDGLKGNHRTFSNPEAMELAANTWMWANQGKLFVGEDGIMKPRDQYLGDIDRLTNPNQLTAYLNQANNLAEIANSMAGEGRSPKRVAYENAARDIRRHVERAKERLKGTPISNKAVKKSSGGSSSSIKNAN